MRERDYTISLIRGFAMCMIVTCHICQYYDLAAAWWFNVGVQIFLSGYLYANKRITDRFSFYRKRLRKILVEYWVFVLPTSLLFWVLAPQIMNPIKMMDLFTAHGTVDGLGHLWYIPYILLCYVLTPLFQDLFDFIDKTRGYKYFVWLVIIFIITHLLFELFASYFNPAWINAYILGMALGRIGKRQDIILKKYRSLIVILTGILFMFHISLKAGIEIEGLWKIIEVLLRDYEHVFLGAFLFVGMRGILSSMCVGGVFLNRLCSFIDEYSYDIYLTHHPFILGPFSFMTVTGSKVCNIFLVLCLTLICAIYLRKISFQIQKKIFEDI